MSAIILRNLVKRYEADMAVHDINLNVEAGEFVVLLGPSGCGKTTTLRMVAGLEDVSEGEIYIGGELANDLAPKDRGIAMVFQNYALYPHMTVRQNMEFALRPLRLDRAEVNRRITETAEILGLDEYLARRPSQLSGGQRQRVAMGRAMVRTPEVFLFDEPLSNLDAKLRTKVRWEIGYLHRRLGMTTLYVTHDQTEAMTLADKIVIMRQGRIEQVGTPEEVFVRPRNTFVATFIGTPAMNLVPAVAVDANLHAKDFSLPMPQKFKNHVPEGLEVLIGIRPSNINLADSGPANVFAASVRGIEYLGTDALLDLRVGSEELVAEIPAILRPEVDAQIHVSFDMQSLQLFDAKTGQSLESL